MNLTQTWMTLPIGRASPQVTPEIAQWIERAQAGDDEALAALYRQFVQTIYRYIYYRVSSQQDAEDLTAEVFVKMVEALPSYQITGAPFEVWLYRVAQARVFDFYRRKGRRPQT